MLNQPLLVNGIEIPNRVVLQPMEGCDCETDGSPSRLTREKYLRAAKSGAGIIWFEANAVCPEGRTNQHQMMLTEKNLPAFQELIEKIHKTAKKECNVRPILILQLTHSGRQSINPMIAYRHPIYEEKRPLSDENIICDDYLDSLKDKYAESAKLAILAGFDGVDVKSCHGYLFQELLSAFTRKGKYGGSFENRTRLYLDCIRAVKNAIPSRALLTSRLGYSDMLPKPYGFGTDENNNIDFSEPDSLIKLIAAEGIKILNITLGNPYYNPHVNRPYRQGGYTPPEEAAAGLARFAIVEKHVKEKFPELFVVASGLSYYRENLIEKSEELLKDGACDLVGYGRMWLAYPEFYRDFTNSNFQSKKCCLACSKCTLLMRNKRVSGCAVFNEYYRNLYKEIK